MALINEKVKRIEKKETEANGPTKNIINTEYNTLFFVGLLKEQYSKVSLNGSQSQWKVSSHCFQDMTVFTVNETDSLSAHFYFTVSQATCNINSYKAL